jgi:Uma2 family endonuclease
MHHLITTAKEQKITGEQFAAICRENPELRLELTSNGELIVMPPCGSDTGARNFRLHVQLGIWINETRTGVGFDSSTGFTLPDGAKRSPDSSWIANERWNALTPEEQESFAPICPDFVAELRSSSDLISQLRDKMVEYLANGAQLGWLIDPLERRVYVYRPHQELVILENPKQVYGDPVLPGFVLEVEELW